MRDIVITCKIWRQNWRLVYHPREQQTCDRLFIIFALILIRRTIKESTQSLNWSRMDVLRDWMECVNYHWLVIVGTGLYMHLREVCLIGLCFESVKDPSLDPPFDPSFASLIFVFSTLCLLAEYRLWPRSLKEPPIQLMIIYEVSNSDISDCFSRFELAFHFSRCWYRLW